jgi:three-Cys-motif partner protein
VPGSPIRILQKVKDHIGNILQKKTKIVLYFNEFERDKCIVMKEACEQYLENNADVSKVTEVHYFQEDFARLFDRLLPVIQVHPALVYLDQNGVKFLERKYLMAFDKMRQTDFLYFVSAALFYRFGGTPEFKSYLEMDMELVRRQPHQFIHRTVLGTARKMLPSETALKLYPYSIKKKEGNVHGIVFGASHPLAVKKFLEIAWSRNGINGEANFDIDEDGKKSQLTLFEGKRLTKIEAFKQKVRVEILSERIIDNIALFKFAQEEGHLGSHAAECVMEMRRENLISFSGRALVSYESVYGNPQKRVEYKILTKR